MRTTAEKRHNDWRKAIRKRRITQEAYHIDEWYDNLHQYSKNKIHCSCPMCRAKTNKKKAGWYNSTNWSIADRRKVEEMEDQLTEE